VQARSSTQSLDCPRTHEAGRTAQRTPEQLQPGQGAHFHPIALYDKSPIPVSSRGAVLPVAAMNGTTRVMGTSRVFNLKDDIAEIERVARKELPEWKLV